MPDNGGQDKTYTSKEERFVNKINCINIQSVHHLNESVAEVEKKPVYRTSKRLKQRQPTITRRTETFLKHDTSYHNMPTRRRSAPCGVETRLFCGFYLKEKAISESRENDVQQHLEKEFVRVCRKPKLPDAITRPGNVSFDLKVVDPIRKEVIETMRSVASDPYSLGVVKRCVVTVYTAANHNKHAPVTAMTLHKDGSSPFITTAVLTLGTFTAGGVDVAVSTKNGNITESSASWIRVTPKSRSLYWFPGGIIEHRALAVLS